MVDLTTAADDIADHDDEMLDPRASDAAIGTSCLVAIIFVIPQRTVLLIANVVAVVVVVSLQHTSHASRHQPWCTSVWRMLPLLLSLCWYCCAGAGAVATLQVQNRPHRRAGDLCQTPFTIKLAASCGIVVCVPLEWPLVSPRVPGGESSACRDFQQDLATRFCSCTRSRYGGGHAYALSVHIGIHSTCFSSTEVHKSIFWRRSSCRASAPLSIH
jgi:hypothetical protein